MGDEPALVDGIAMEAAGKLVIDAATGHFFEGRFGHGEKMFFFRLLIALKDQVDSRRVRELRGAAEAAVLNVEKLRDGFDLRVDDAGVEISSGAGEDFRLRNCVGERVGGALKFGAFVTVGIGDGEKDAAKSRPAHLVFRRKIGTAEKRLSIGKQEAGEWPAALAGNGADSGLIAGVNVGAFVPVDFHSDEMFVDDLRDFGVLVGFAVDDVAPVAPYCADVEEDGFVLGLGAGESGIAPFVPVDGLVRGRAQIGAGGIFQAVFRMTAQAVLKDY